MRAHCKWALMAFISHLCHLRSNLPFSHFSSFLVPSNLLSVPGRAEGAAWWGQQAFINRDRSGASCSVEQRLGHAPSTEQRWVQGSSCHLKAWGQNGESNGRCPGGKIFPPPQTTSTTHPPLLFILWASKEVSWTLRLTFSHKERISHDCAKKPGANPQIVTCLVYPAWNWNQILGFLLCFGSVSASSADTILAPSKRVPTFKLMLLTLSLMHLPETKRQFKGCPVPSPLEKRRKNVRGHSKVLYRTCGLLRTYGQTFLTIDVQML